MNIPSILLSAQRITSPRSLGGHRGFFQRVRNALGGGASGLQRLAFPMQSQEQANWCWSAVSTSVARFFDSGSQWTQCSVANTTLGETTCCVQGDGPNCNKPWTLDSALRVVGHFRSKQSSPVGFQGVRGEIGNDRPVGIRVAWDASSAHFLVIDGWRVADSGQQYYFVSDSIFGRSIWERSRLENSYQNVGTWTHSYLLDRSRAGGAMMAVVSPVDPHSMGG
jgi:hypothetical protein